MVFHTTGMFRFEILVDFLWVQPRKFHAAEFDQIVSKTDARKTPAFDGFLRNGRNRNANQNSKESLH
jgi:hypothetical protein